MKLFNQLIFAVLAILTCWYQPLPDFQKALRSPAQAAFDETASVIHWPPNSAQVRPEKLEEIFASQATLAFFLLKHPEYSVFAEGEPEGYGANEYQNLARDQNDLRFTDANRLFSKAFPKEASAFTSEQKLFLAKTGAIKTLFLIGKLKEVRRTLTVEEGNANGAAVKARVEELGGFPNPVLSDPVLFKLIMSDREEYAVREIKSFLQGDPTHRKALLVFGGTHQFESYFKGIRFSRYPN